MTKKTETTKKKRNFCEYCNKIVIGSTFKFKSHLFRHDAVKSRFKCEYCSKEYFRSDTYALHLRSHTGEKSVKKYVCDYCDRSFVNKFNLIVHLKNIHDDTIDSRSVRFTCPACSVSFCEKRVLDNHVRKYHFNIELNHEPVHFNKDLNETWYESVVSTDACVEMTKINNNVLVIKKCSKIENLPIVNKSRVKKPLYGAHFVDQYSKAICDYCKKEMVKKSLKNHIRERHLNLRRFSCSECRKTFKRHYQMVNHNCKNRRKRKK